MNIEIIDLKGSTIAEIVGEGLAMQDESSALDLMAQAGELGAQAILLFEQHLPPAFFDLSTRRAGDILNKFAVYRFKLAIVGDFGKYQSKSLQAFIRESNRGQVVYFTADRDEALEWLVRVR